MIFTTFLLWRLAMSSGVRPGEQRDFEHRQHSGIIHGLKCQEGIYLCIYL